MRESVGACTVVVDGKALRSCLTPLKQVAGTEVLTVEGLARQGRLHPLQQAFIDHGAFQCGYCTSGMLMDAYALLKRRSAPVAREDHRATWTTICAAAARTSASSRRSKQSRPKRPGAGNEPPLRASAGATSSGLVGGGIVVLFGLSPSTPPAAAERPGYPEDFNAYLAIGADGRITVFSGKIEMGQGVMTSQAQMAAEELGVALASIDMVLGDTDRCPWDMGTFGSLTTRMFGPALRAAAAKARSLLTTARSG